MPIKYLGSKRTLIPALVDIAKKANAQSAVDLFTGTTRVAQAFKKQGIYTSASDIATYSHVFAQCYIETNADNIDYNELASIIERLNGLKGKPGYFTETFCVDARYFQPKNGERVDVIRDVIEREYKDAPVYPILLTSLIEAADKVDSTVGLQMAYLKQWAKRAESDMRLLVPELISGNGKSYLGDALEIAQEIPEADLVYLDPPYNQHRYFTNYHIWESLVRWDKPEVYGIANKRIDARDDSTKSSFNRKAEMPLSMKKVLESVKGKTIVLSYNNESWLSADTLMEWMKSLGKESVIQLDFDFKRHVGSLIGVYNPKGERVGTPSHSRNVEHIFVAGGGEIVDSISYLASAR